MGKLKPPLSVRQSLVRLGEDLRKARLRRRLRMALIAERAGISRETLAKVQKGDPGVSMGAYASVIFALGLGVNWMRLADIVNDPTALALESDQLPKRAREPKRSF